MKKFIITSDSSCDLGEEKAKEIDVKCIYLSYTIDGEVFYDDMVSEHIDEFYEKMKNGAVPKTSQASPVEYFEFFEQFVNEDLPILHLSIGSLLSGSYRSATIAVEMIKEQYPNADIRLIDTTISSAGLAMLIYEAVKYRDKGQTVEEAIAHIDGIKEFVNTCITTNDLTYLRRGGRVSAAGAIVSSVLSISPFITLSKAGKLYVCNKVRGSKNTIDKFCSFVSNSVLKPELQTIYIVHSNAIEKAKEIGQKLRDRLGFENIEYMKFGTTIGSHAGPGLVSAFYFGKLRPIHL